MLLGEGYLYRMPYFMTTKIMNENSEKNFGKIAHTGAHLSKNSHVQNHIFQEIHIFKSHFQQNSHF